MTDTIHTVTLTPQEQAAFESGRKIGWNEGIEAAADELERLWAFRNWRGVDEAIRALSMPAPAQAWRDISAAPRDESVIVAVRAEEGFDAYTFVRWSEDKGWVGYAGQHSGLPVIHQPTHWMPLPAPPAALIPDTEGGA